MLNSEENTSGLMGQKVETGKSTLQQALEKRLKNRKEKDLNGISSENAETAPASEY